MDAGQRETGAALFHGAIESLRLGVRVEAKGRCIRPAIGNRHPDLNIVHIENWPFFLQQADIVVDHMKRPLIVLLIQRKAQVFLNALR